MSTETRRVVEAVNDQGIVEKRVETVDYQTPAGQGQQMRSVEVVHLVPQENLKTSGGVLAGAAAAVANTLEKAKEAISENK